MSEKFLTFLKCSLYFFRHGVLEGIYDVPLFQVNPKIREEHPMSQQFPPNQQPPYQQPYYPPHPPKQPGISTGFKLVVGGCLALVVISGGFIVACGVWVGSVSKGLKDSNLSRTNPTAAPPSSAPLSSPSPETLQASNLPSSELLKEAKEILKNKNAGENLAKAVNDLNAITVDAPEYKEAQVLLKQANARNNEYQRLKESNLAVLSRNELLESYRSTYANANPYLNYIKTKITKEKNGYAIWLIHSMFTQSSFDVGSDAHTVQAWINANRSELARASIKKVGLQNESGYLGSCWLEIK
jgi:hypothetical protein